MLLLSPLLFKEPLPLPVRPFPACVKLCLFELAEELSDTVLFTDPIESRLRNCIVALILSSTISCLEYPTVRAAAVELVVLDIELTLDVDALLSLLLALDL